MARRAQIKSRKITAEDVRKLVVPSDPQIDGNGERIAFVHKLADEPSTYCTEIWIASADGVTKSRRLTAGPRDRSPRWSPDGTSIAFIREAERGNPQIMLAAIRGMKLAAPKKLTKLPDGSIGNFRFSPSGDEIAFAYRQTLAERTTAAAKARTASGRSTPPLVIDDPWYRLDGDGVFGSARFRLHILNIRTRRIRELALGDTLGTFSFDWSPDGKTIAATINRSARALFEPWKMEIVIADVRTGKIKALDGLSDGPKSSVTWSPDGTMVAYAGRIGRTEMYATENLGLFVHDLRTKITRNLLRSSDFCLMSATLSDSVDTSFASWIQWMPGGDSLLMRIGWHGSGHIASASLGGNFIALHTPTGAEHLPCTLSRDGARIALIRSAPTEPPEVCVADITGREFPVRQVTRINSALCDELDLALPEESWIKAKDGVAVHYWTMRPPKSARAGRKTPGVLEVHGGPHAQYGWAFFHEFQLLAAEGYTVVYGNPRGSKGYGRAFCQAIQGTWGGKDWMDVQAITRAMRNDRGIDNARIGIMGGSYGGFMTLWAVGHSSEYCGAISDRCVSNIVSHSGNSDLPDVPGIYWTGSAYSDPKHLWKSSPIASFSKARTPMLLIHSEGDLRCNIEQSEQVHAALAVQNVPVRFVKYPRETSHGMSRAGPPDLRMHRLGEILAWWKKIF